jgi:hypothetical protein
MQQHRGAAHWRQTVAQSQQAKRRVPDVGQREVQQRVQRACGTETLARKKDDPRRAHWPKVQLAAGPK